MMHYVVVGAGFAGSVCAERLATAGRTVLLVDRRAHVGGNAYDYYDDAGILVHKYGAHVFHTNSADVFAYLSRFTEWRPYQHRVLASVDGRLVPVPINLDTLDALDLPADLAMGRLYEPYTLKQWGVEATALLPGVLARVRPRTNRDGRYFTDKYQAMPRHGYTRLFERLTAHPNIHVMLKTSYRDIADHFEACGVVYTGPLDEYYGRSLGRLPYRSAEFRFETLPVEQVQAVGVINYPDQYDYTRVTEFKHLTGQRHPWTTVAYEYPRADGEPYWPVQTAAAQELRRRYLALSSEQSVQAPARVWFAGRLGTFQYLNMDQCVAQALKLAATILEQERRYA